MKKLEDYLSGNFPPSPAYAYVVKRYRKTYNQFIRDFESMTKEELETFDILYSFMHYSILSHLNTMFKNKTFFTAPEYCLIGTHSMPVSTKNKIYEGEILKVTGARVVNMFVKNFIKKHPEDVPYAPEWCKQLFTAGQYCAEEITRNFPFSPKQIGLESGIDFDDVDKIWIAIPNIEDNKKVISKAMSFFGYFLLSDEFNEHRSKITGTPWHVLTFSPNNQKYVNEKIFKENKYLYHVSPTKFEHKILRQGLVPLSKNAKFNYPNRIYLVLSQRQTLSMGDITFDFEKDLNEILEMLTKDKILINNEFVNENLFTIYRVDISKLSDDVKFSYDMEYKPLGIFTANNISPNAIKIIDHFDLSSGKPPFTRIVEM